MDEYIFCFVVRIHSFLKFSWFLKLWIPSLLLNICCMFTGSMLFLTLYMMSAALSFAISYNFNKPDFKDSVFVYVT